MSIGWRSQLLGMDICLAQRSRILVEKTKPRFDKPPNSMLGTSAWRSQSESYSD
jgi:hypothetical protein